MPTELTKKFSEIVYERPDLAAAAASFESSIEKLASAESYAEARQVYLDQEAAQERLATMSTVAHIRNTCDTSDPFYDGEMTYFHTELPKFGPIAKRADAALLASPFRADFEREFGSYFLKVKEMDQRLESEEIIPEKIEEGRLGQEYSKLVAQCAVDFDGEKCNFYGLLKHMQSPDRGERKRAFEAWAKMYEEVSPKLDAIFDKLVALRVRLAKKLGFPSFIDYIYPARGRYDYGADDAAAFRESVRKYVTPACAKLYELQRRRLGVDTLRYYDESLFSPEGNALPEGTRPELVEKARLMYREMSPETGEFFDFMAEHELYDLESRPGKHMGGYCTFLQEYRAPFIFSNFNGTSADVDVLTHEAGHAFESYTASRSLPLLSLVWSTSEINEIHSMTMEHFAYPWMESFFADAGKYRRAHLTDALRTIPYLVSVDEFQHRVFEKPDMSAAERRAAWREIEKKYMPWRDYDGNEFLEQGGFWMQKQHIFLYPFYYIDYALAQVCAFQYYAMMKRDRASAWAKYLSLCRAGGSKGYFELLDLGGLRRPFDEETVKSVVDDIMSELCEQKER